MTAIIWVMAIAEIETAIEIETKNELLALDLLRIVGQARFFGGKLGGESVLTREMNGSLKYCRNIPGAIVSLGGLTYPENLDIEIHNGVIYGIALPVEFAEQLLSFPEQETSLLVVAAVMQRNKIMLAACQSIEEQSMMTEARYDLVAKCQDHFSQAAGKISGRFFGFGDFLTQQLDIKLV